MEVMNFNISGVEVLGESNEEVSLYRKQCEARDIPVRGEFVWNGPVPPNSFMMVAPTIRMSTPEYFAFRKSNEMDVMSAVHVVAELLSNVRTALTCHSMDADTFEDLAKVNGPRMGAAEYREYLEPVADTPQGLRAIAVLESAVTVVGEYESFVRTNLEESTD